MARVESFSYFISFAGHALLLAAMALFALVQGCFTPKEEEIIPIEFTVVTDENLMPPELDTPANETPEPPQPEQPPELPEPAPPPEPPQPEPPPELPQPEPPKPEPPKPEPPKPEPPKKKEFKKGPRITRKVVTPDADVKKYDPKKQSTERALSPEEVKKLLDGDAKPGATANQIPPNEASRCVALIRAAFQSAMAKEGVRGNAGSTKPCLKVVFDKAGRVKSCTIARSSGDAAYDAEVLRAGRSVDYVPGLTVAYLSKMPTVTIDIESTQ